LGKISGKKKLGEARFGFDRGKRGRSDGKISKKKRSPGAGESGRGLAPLAKARPLKKQEKCHSLVKRKKKGFDSVENTQDQLIRQHMPEREKKPVWKSREVFRTK